MSDGASTRLLALAVALALVAFSCDAAGRVPLHRLGLHPDELARALLHVEDDWLAQAVAFSACNSSAEEKSCRATSKSFKNSCNLVVIGVMQGSGGDRASMKKYMDDVCSTPVLTGWHKQRCQKLTSFFESTMMEDNLSFNRKSMRSEDLCQKLWLRFLSEEKDNIAKEAERQKDEMQNHNFTTSRRMAERLKVNVELNNSGLAAMPPPVEQQNKPQYQHKDELKHQDEAEKKKEAMKTIELKPQASTMAKEEEAHDAPTSKVKLQGDDASGVVKGETPKSGAEEVHAAGSRTSLLAKVIDSSGSAGSAALFFVLLVGILGMACLVFA